VTISERQRARRRIRVTGLVQGVGYRPFVYALAERYGVSGFVGNDAAGVFLEVEGPPDAVTAFVAALRTEAPPLAVVDDVTEQDIAVTGTYGFHIVRSENGTAPTALVTPDSATCAECLRELTDPRDRRHEYPFVNCTNCGPRFTITRTVPYDRRNTTMASFALCPTCQAEYDDPRDRRFHAQPTCCPACGPHLELLTAAGQRLDGDPVEVTANLIRAGRVVATKGLGGYHLAVDAANEIAVAALRRRKHREDKPFAIMARHLADAEALCELDAAARDLLGDRRCPIVLAPRRAHAPVAPSVAPHTRELGLLLPYTPLHHLLARRLAGPIVLTSGNVSDEPIAYEDADARARLAPIADAFLQHDRAIHVRTDDSVARSFRGVPMLLRRSRGYVPAPLTLPVAAIRPVLACGAQLKNTVCLARGPQAFVSHHIGDLENYETYRSFTDAIAHFRDLFGIQPKLIAHDLHPEYLSTKYAQSFADAPLLGVQHHHAHIASCLADNGRADRVIGVACDGTGYGADGTLWGGEILVADLHGYRRVAHLVEVPLPGGSTAVRQPWRMAVAYLVAAFGDPPRDLDVLRRHPDWPAVAGLARSAATLRTSSAGRLLDAVSALVGVRDSVTYEGQAAIELEQRVDPAVTAGYPMRVADGLLHGSDLVAAAADDLRNGVAVATIAGRVHAGLAAGLAAAVAQVAAETGLRSVALSGGVFQNVVLLGGLVDRLSALGLDVLIHHQVPPNDGGISFGQAAIAAATDRV
jgi:hydrogenase maturation protein HypF